MRLLVRVTVEENEEGIFGFVVTFDDVTDLEAAQRKAAWSDVARRIAHEIKNPLTPIQLSAERLRRKYLKQIKHEPETFQTCTDTIIRHVEDIGRMVNEFSSFARMPAPVMVEENLQDVIEEGVTLERSVRSGITYALALPEKPVRILCDRQQLAQVMTNLLLNAAQSIEAREASDDDAPFQGLIEITLDVKGSDIVIEVADNGRGLPQAERHRLTEPYITTREGGTGLGLAIAKKIIEDHSGRFELLDRSSGGALARMTFSGSIRQLDSGDDPENIQEAHKASVQ